MPDAIGSSSSVDMKLVSNSAKEASSRHTAFVHGPYMDGSTTNASDSVGLRVVSDVVNCITVTFPLDCIFK